MPREVIHADTPGQPYRMEVGWNRDAMDVQVGISTADHGTLVTHLYDGYREEVAKNLIETLASAGWVLMPEEGPETRSRPAILPGDTLGAMVLEAVSVSSPFGSSVWWHPSRNQINTLIRHLRKARDAAFGADA